MHKLFKKNVIKITIIFALSIFIYINLGSIGAKAQSRSYKAIFGVEHFTNTVFALLYEFKNDDNLTAFQLSAPNEVLSYTKVSCLEGGVGTFSCNYLLSLYFDQTDKMAMSYRFLVFTSSDDKKYGFMWSNNKDEAISETLRLCNEAKGVNCQLKLILDIDKGILVDKLDKPFKLVHREFSGINPMDERNINVNYRHILFKGQY